MKRRIIPGYRLPALSVLMLAAAMPSVPAGPAQAGLRDKTLVAWVSPANLIQHGGSVLTIDDARSHFDGIVFGELSPGRWMAGSDFYRRTHREQGPWAEETSDSKALVQVAITYRGKQVTLYRNGRPYAEYTMASPPQEFGPQSVVVIGKRHLEQQDDAHFIGAIEDARIYDVALPADQIAALNLPGQPRAQLGPCLEHRPVPLAAPSHRAGLRHVQRQLLYQQRRPSDYVLSPGRPGQCHGGCG